MSMGASGSLSRVVVVSCFFVEEIVEALRPMRAIRAPLTRALVVLGLKSLILFLVLSPPLLAAVQESNPMAREEISHLISHLAASGCQFNRNGSWYDASRAVEHLNRKYEYLLRKNLVPTAEAFIERAASESSASGKPYLVKCGDQAHVQSAIWFREALAKFRAEASSAAKYH